jgi:3-phosphoshikimate 1-carboxyvinyltransferase
MSDLTLTPFERPFVAKITPPGSKSLTNRALVLAALGTRRCVLRNILFADDTRVMLEGLRKLGFDLQVDDAAHTVTVAGRSGELPAGEASIFCGNSGTTIRFLTALCAQGRGVYTLDGIERMQQRPIGQLVDMLKNLGARIEYPGNPGFPPVRVLGDRLAGGTVAFAASQSSQYLSAVLQVSPYARHEVRVELGPGQTSWPYVAMTMQLMDQFGVTPELFRDPKTSEPRRIHVPQGQYTAEEYVVEPDASNASYFLAAAAVREGAKVTIEGLGKSSLQGDVGFADVLHRMGADLVFGNDFITITGTGTLEGIDIDLASMPDMAQTLAVVALFADGPTTLRGLHTLRVKETDRIDALARELTKLGAEVDVEGNDMTIHPSERGLTPAHIDTYDDHRMAMSFAVAGTRQAGVTIRNIECVNKTYPEFFQDLEKLRS